MQPLPSRQYSSDNGFKAKYRVLEKAFVDFPADTIEFVAYDHYGIPAFSEYQNALLFVSANSGTYYQQKYMYNDVYKTKDGRWAGSYAGDDGKQITLSYPKPYFKTVGDSAFAVHGNYVEDLFKLKRDGYLTAREIFKNGKLVQ